MGKILDRLNEQAKEEGHQKDAEECLKVYNFLMSDPKGALESQWTPLVKVKFIGEPPLAKKYYRLSRIGKAVLRGINSNPSEDIE